MPRVSVILPAYNAAATVGRAIASIRTQTFTDWELLVIDDGSRDETLTAATASAALDQRIRVLARPHEGLVAALNAGLAEARGELIARMDADDESDPDRLAAQVELLAARPDIGLASCRVAFAGDRAANAGYALHIDWLNSLLTPQEIALNRFIESPLAHPSVLFRRELLDRLGGYRAGDFPEDYEIWLRWLGAGVHMAKVPRVLLHWNDSPTRLSRIDDRYAPDAFFRTKAQWIAAEITGHRLLEKVPAAPDGPVLGSQSRRRLYVWGAGRPTRKRAAYLESNGLSIAGYIDVDPSKHTSAIGGTGRPVISPDALPSPNEAFVLAYVSSRGARDLIRAALRTRNYIEGRDFLVCA